MCNRHPFVLRAFFLCFSLGLALFWMSGCGGATNQSKAILAECRIIDSHITQGMYRKHTVSFPTQNATIEAYFDHGLICRMIFSGSLYRFVSYHDANGRLLYVGEFVSTGNGQKKSEYFFQDNALVLWQENGFSNVYSEEQGERKTREIMDRLRDYRYEFAGVYSWAPRENQKEEAPSANMPIDSLDDALLRNDKTAIDTENVRLDATIPAASTTNEPIRLLLDEVTANEKEDEPGSD